MALPKLSCNASHSPSYLLVSLLNSPNAGLYHAYLSSHTDASAEELRTRKERDSSLRIVAENNVSDLELVNILALCTLLLLYLITSNYLNTDDTWQYVL